MWCNFLKLFSFFPEIGKTFPQRQGVYDKIFFWIVKVKILQKFITKKSPAHCFHIDCLFKQLLFWPLKSLAQESNPSNPGNPQELPH
jgi:hypothetical protein